MKMNEQLDYGKIKKCAIYVHYSINDFERIEEQKNKLIKFCEDVLQTNNYELFIEIGSCLGERKVFNSMLERFKSGEFSHLVVTHFNRIYRPNYNFLEAQNIKTKIQSFNVSIVCIDEECNRSFQKKKSEYEK